MGRTEHDGAASPFGLGPSPPLSGGSSPSPLLPVPNAKTRFAGRRRHVFVRLICSPFAAVFRTACSAGASATAHEDQATRRPRLEELLRMEASSSNLLDIKQPDEPEMVDPYDDDDDSWKHSAIVVFDLSEDGDKSRPIIQDEKDEAPLATSEDQHGAITCPGDEKEPAEELDAGAGGGAMLSPKALVNVERLVVVLASLGARSRGLKGSYGRLAGRRVGGAGGDKAELFYDRPIPLGRRCRVQHLEESPYL